ncbi:MAG: tetratricopeptide repeat protein [Candidatus Eremiobacteraeota bacterium]|nr:tetratricopeptide repeat protein [Candidatus Eremiobacteraeota bacterium]
MHAQGKIPLLPLIITALALLLAAPGGCKGSTEKNPLPIKTAPVNEPAREATISEDAGALIYSSLDIPGAILQELTTLELETKLKALKHSGTLEGKLKTGHIYLSLGEPSNALSLFKELTEKYPLEVKPLCSMAAALFQQGDFNGSMAFLGRARTLSPASAEPSITLGEAWTRCWNFPDGIKEFDQALKLEKKNAYLFMARGDLYFTKGDFDLARENYRQSAALAPREIMALEKEGTCEIILGNYKKGLELIRRAYRQSPGNTVTGYRLISSLRDPERTELCRTIGASSGEPAKTLFSLVLAKFLIDGGQYGEACTLIEGLTGKKGFPRAGSLLYAYALHRSGRTDQAMKLTSSLLEGTPWDWSGHGLMAVMHLSLKDYGNALIESEKAFEIDPLAGRSRLLRSMAGAPLLAGEPVAIMGHIRSYEEKLKTSREKAPLHFILGALYSRAAEYGGAIRHFREASESSKHDMFYRRHYARLLMESSAIEDRKKAEALLQSVLKARPDDPLAHREKGMLSLKNSSAEKALDEFRRALAIFHGDGAAWYFCGVTENLKKNHAPALRDLVKALDASPSVPDIFLEMAKSYEGLKKPESALLLYRQFELMEKEQGGGNHEALSMARAKIEAMEKNLQKNHRHEK